MKTLRVSYLPESQIGSVPYIRLRGAWLRAAGFEIGDQMTVSVEQGKLTFTVAK